MLSLMRKDVVLHKMTLYGGTPALAVYMGWFDRREL